jgi:hypothetical protein
MPRKVGPRTVTAGEVINYFETQSVSDAALVFGIVKDRMVARTTPSVATRLRTAAERIRKAKSVPEPTAV